MILATTDRFRHRRHRDWTALLSAAILGAVSGLAIARVFCP